MKRSLFQRARSAVKAFYEGARYRIGYPWIPTTYQSAHLDLASATRQTLQAKARYFERNSPLVNRLTDIFEAYTVGTGLQVHPQSSDVEWNRSARVWWQGWERFADVSSRQTFGTLQSLIARSWFIDGEAFVILTASPDTGRPRVQVIEAHQVKTPPDLASEEGKSIIDGVEIDPVTKRPLAYWIVSAIQDGKEVLRKYASDSVVHVFEPSRPGQYRGIPFLSAATNLLADLVEIEKLEMKAARAAAVVANVLYSKPGEMSGEDLLASGGAVSTSSSGQVTAYREQLGGETIVLDAGDKLEQFKSERPTAVAMDYHRQLRADVCAACGIPSVLAYPEQMQGTQYRGALDMAATFFKCRSAVIQELIRRIWEHVIPASAKEPEIAGAPKDWWRITVPSPRAVNVDVGRNSAAMIAELQAGVTTFSQVYGPLGIHWEDAFEELARQRQRAIELGILSAPTPQQQPTPTA